MPMDSQQKLNAKRVIQVLMPNVPAPFVDYALNTQLAVDLADSMQPSPSTSNFTIR